MFYLSARFNLFPNNDRCACLHIPIRTCFSRGFAAILCPPTLVMDGAGYGCFNGYTQWFSLCVANVTVLTFHSRWSNSSQCPSWEVIICVRADCSHHHISPRSSNNSFANQLNLKVPRWRKRSIYLKSHNGDLNRVTNLDPCWTHVNLGTSGCSCKQWPVV